MDIIIERGKVCELKDLPPYSVAVDGFVQGPEIDDENHRFSWDHHAKCIRFCTLSATGQAYTAILLGFDPTDYTFYLNDVDIDSCGVIWCMQNIDRCKEPNVKKLIDAISTKDMHAGAISVNGMDKVVEWISAPETESKKEGDYEKLSHSGMKSILEAVLHRIDRYVDGEALEEISVFTKSHKHSEFKILRNEKGWILVESNDPHIYSQLYQSGYDRIVLVRKLQDSLAVSFAKRSDFIENFSLPKIYAEINKIEPGAGGGSTLGGVVRNKDGSRSKLSIEKITEIVDKASLGD